jgi:Tfp pilus assembly protein PilF
MQALRKAERAKKSHARDDGLTKPSEEFDGVLSLMLHEPEHEPDADGNSEPGFDLDRTHEPGASADRHAGPAAMETGRSAPGSGPELRLSPVEDGIPVLEPLLEPLDYTPGRQNYARPGDRPAPAPIPEHTAIPSLGDTVAPAATATTAPRDEPAIHMEGTHDTGRVETPRPAAAPRAPRGETAVPHPRPRTGAAPAQGPRPRGRGKDGAEAKVIAIDPGTLRLAVLAGLLLLLVAAFAFMYWRAISGPGDGSRLPMVPMPQQGVSAPVPGNGMAVIAPDANSRPATAATAPVSDEALGGPVESGPAQAQAPAQTLAQAQGPSAEPLPDRSFTPPVGPALQRPATGPSSLPPDAMPDPSGGGAAPQFRNQPALAAGAEHVAAPAHGGARFADNQQQRSSSAQQQQGGTEGADIRVRRNDTAPRINPGLQAAYQAFNDGDLAAARQQYQAVIRQEPANRDALMGMAALALRQKDAPQAAAQYVRMLELDPNDAEALAGLTSLHMGDPAQSEGRLKAVLQNNPESGPVLFALGNLYSQQARWSEAQQMYFRAYAAVPSNADYAFNLAVGLDRLNQGKIALGYYQRALALASNGVGSFDRAAARRRLHELTMAGAPAPAVATPSAPPAQPQP